MLKQNEKQLYLHSRTRTYCFWVHAFLKIFILSYNFVGIIGIKDADFDIFLLLVCAYT